MCTRLHLQLLLVSMRWHCLKSFREILSNWRSSCGNSQTSSLGMLIRWFIYPLYNKIQYDLWECSWKILDYNTFSLVHCCDTALVMTYSNPQTSTGFSLWILFKNSLTVGYYFFCNLTWRFSGQGFTQMCPCLACKSCLSFLQNVSKLWNITNMTHLFFNIVSMLSFVWKLTQHWDNMQSYWCVFITQSNFCQYSSCQIFISLVLRLK